MFKVIITLALIVMPGAAFAQSCKAAKSCAEAVQMWCEGYAAADRDNDGIPCENVCKSKKQVDALMKKNEACSTDAGDDKAGPQDLGVMGSDGIIRSEAEAMAFEASKKR